MEDEIHQRDKHLQQELEQEQGIRRQISEFITNLRNHFLEEEQIVFPLALKADSS